MKAFKRMNYKSARLVTQRVNRYDPTRTTMLRNAFVSQMNKRFNKLNSEIKKAIVDLDVFGLKDPQVMLARRAFDFPRSQDKVDSFMKWLEDLTDRELLTLSQRPQIGVAIEEPWTNLYVEDSYKRGVIRSRYEMKRAGLAVPSLDRTGGISASMSTPFHIDRVGVLYTRVFEELKGVTATMSTQISRTLSAGIMNGDGPQLLARKMNAVITGTRSGDLGITDTLGRFIPARRRAQMIARTEVIRAHHQGMVQEYRNWAVAGVKVKAEFVTTDDLDVCEKCASLQGRIYTLEEIENLIPVHPNCRCISIPVAEEDEDILQEEDTIEEIPETAEFHPAKNRKEAAEWAKKNLDVDFVDFDKLDLDIANQMNQTMFQMKQIMPEVKMNGYGSSSAMIKALKNDAYLYYQKSDRYKKIEQLMGVEYAKKQAMQFANNQVPRVGKDVVAFSLPKRGTQSMSGAGVWNPDKYAGVYVNPVYGGNVNTMNSIVANNHRSGWWARGADDFRFIMSHELGHEVDALLGFQNTRNFMMVFNREHAKGVQHVTDRLSKYGATAGGRTVHLKHEMIAEAWAEYLTSSTPRGLATEVAEDMMNEYYVNFVHGTKGISSFYTWKNQILKILKIQL